LKETPSNELSYDISNRRRLWSASEKLVHDFLIQ
jgi:hypothetical protein